MCWLKVPIRWGELEVNSPWDGIEPFASVWPIRKYAPQDIGNDAVPGPTYNDGWEGVGAVGGYGNY